MSLESRVAALETRLKLLEDQEKVRQCLARYGYNADLGRSEEYVAVWTDDGLYDLADDTKLAGKAQIRQMITSPAGAHKSEIENRSLHTVGNLFIKIEGDTAWAEGYSVVFVKQADGVRPYTAGYNHWDFARDGDGWLMSRRLRRAIGGSEWGGETIKSYLDEPR
ncbi:nuclear transport factor 2 family protein [Phenylobacterium sp.]|jgi:ketosteroid isomerase-like protein|uniref:nuclear transport factor 2 family protein n=1 Tax=Phenylobacterium sp. TaxID=1871053 RepID=UPI002F3E77BF